MNTHATTDEDKNYPELLSDIAQQVETKLAALGQATEDAKRMGWEIAEHVRSHFQGELIYIPKGRGFEASQLHQQIWDEFNGHNVPQLATEFDLSEVQVRCIIKHVRRQQARKNQSTLPGFEPPTDPC